MDVVKISILPPKQESSSAKRASKLVARPKGLQISTTEGSKEPSQQERAFGKQVPATERAETLKKFDLGAS